MYFSIDADILKQSDSGFSHLISSIKICAEDVREVGMSLKFKDLCSEIFSLKIRRQAKNMEKLSRKIESFRDDLNDITTAYLDNDRNLKEEMKESKKGVQRRENLTEKSGIFDDQGGYGGDQGNMYKNKKMKFMFWTFTGNQALYDLVRTYPQYRNYSDDQITDLFDRINQESCGYVAMVNAIFVQYHGDAEAFERDFGFPMYDENGEYNFDRLLLDIYAETDDKYYLDEEYGTTALTNDILKTYEDNEEAFEDQYGIPLYSNEDKTRFNPEAQQAVLDEYKDTDVVFFKNEGVNRLSYENRMQHYLRSRNIPVSAHYEHGTSPETLRNYLDEGKSVTIMEGEFNLYNEDGSVAYSDVGPHGMTLTGVTEDGRYIVSSWGEKYYLNPGELKWQDVEVVDIYV